MNDRRDDHFVGTGVRWGVVPFALIVGGVAFFFGIIGVWVPKFIAGSLRSPGTRSLESEVREFAPLRDEGRTRTSIGDSQRAALMRRFHERALEKVDWRAVFAEAGWRPLRIASGTRVSAALLMIVGAFLLIGGRRTGLGVVQLAAVLLVVAAGIEAIGIDRTLFDWCSGVARDVRSARGEWRIALGLPESQDFDSPIGVLAGRPANDIRIVILAALENLRPGPTWRIVARILFFCAAILPAALGVAIDVFARRRAATSDAATLELSPKIEK